jgi:hypothetical protein
VSIESMLSLETDADAVTADESKDEMLALLPVDTFALDER